MRRTDQPGPEDEANEVLSDIPVVESCVQSCAVHAMSRVAWARSFPWKAHLQRMCRHPYQIGGIRKGWHAILSK